MAKGTLKSGAKFKDGLEDTLLQHPEITEVHFNADGGHHFNVFPSGGKMYGNVIKQPVTVPDPKTGKPTEVIKEYPVIKTMIVETLKREQILGTLDK